MRRKCHIAVVSPDGRKSIYVDDINRADILEYVNRTAWHKKRWRHIVELILQGHQNTELYDKEEISAKCKGVTAMKFFKGQENDRIYCKEQQTNEGLFIILAAVVYEEKKTQKVSKKEIPIIENIGQYEYEIEKL